MKKGNAFAIAGVSVAVLVGLYLVFKPKKAAGQGDSKTDKAPSSEGCPPTFVKCPPQNTGPVLNIRKGDTGGFPNAPTKCYNPLLVDSRGLYPNGTNPCSPFNDAPDFDYSYFDISSQNPGADDTIYG